MTPLSKYAVRSKKNMGALLRRCSPAKDSVKPFHVALRWHTTNFYTHKFLAIASPHCRWALSDAGAASLPLTDVAVATRTDGADAAVATRTDGQSASSWTPGVSSAPSLPEEPRPPAVHAGNGRPAIQPAATPNTATDPATSGTQHSGPRPKLQVGYFTIAKPMPFSCFLINN